MCFVYCAMPFDCLDQIDCRNMAHSSSWRHIYANQSGWSPPRHFTCSAMVLDILFPGFSLVIASIVALVTHSHYRTSIEHGRFSLESWLGICNLFNIETQNQSSLPRLTYKPARATKWKHKPRGEKILISIPCHYTIVLITISSFPLLVACLNWQRNHHPFRPIYLLLQPFQPILCPRTWERHR